MPVPLLPQLDRLGGLATPTKITRPSPPGLPCCGGKSVPKRGFQLLHAHTLPAASIWTAVIRISGHLQGSVAWSYSSEPSGSVTGSPPVFRV